MCVHAPHRKSSAGRAATKTAVATGRASARGTGHEVQLLEVRTRTLFNFEGITLSLRFLFFFFLEASKSMSCFSVASHLIFLFSVHLFCSLRFASSFYVHLFPPGSSAGLGVQTRPISPHPPSDPPSKRSQRCRGAGGWVAETSSAIARLYWGIRKRQHEQ